MKITWKGSGGGTFWGSIGGLEKRSSAGSNESGGHRPFAGLVHTGDGMQQNCRVPEECHGTEAERIEKRRRCKRARGGSVDSNFGGGTS